MSWIFFFRPRGRPLCVQCAQQWYDHGVGNAKLYGREWKHSLRERLAVYSVGPFTNMVLPIAFYFHYNIWGCMCSTGPFHYGWLKGYIYSSCYYHQIGIIHLSHCYHIFPWLCAWDVCYIIFCQLLHIPSGKTGNLFSLLWSLWWVQIVGYVLPCGSYLFVCTVHHLIIIIVKTYLKTLNLQNACQIYFVECVSKIKHILSVIHYTIHYTICGAVSFNHSLNEERCILLK